MEKKIKVTYECQMCAEQHVITETNHEDAVGKTIEHLNNGDKPCEGLSNPVHMEEVE